MKRSTGKMLVLLVLLAAALLVLPSCSSDETKAKKMYADAVNKEYEEGVEKALPLYIAVISKYPDTEKATSARERVMRHKNNKDELEKKQLLEAERKAKELLLKEQRERERRKPKVFSTSVSGYLKTNIYVEEGDLISITATGRIRFGLFAGSAGPGGLSGFTMYNLVSGARHGSLLAKVTGNDGWFKIGSKGSFKAGSPGFVEFLVNDSATSDNSGMFQAKIVVTK